jgi:protein-S-isoprenylcysteine O-methyltransferase Ste14
VLLGIYVWATIVFGMRFSNLTNRGILSRGPYAIVRHPAYISKNLAWWLMSVPFMRDWISTAGLISWNLVYLVRAFTEERHLRQDRHYREYCERVRWRFVPGLF